MPTAFAELVGRLAEAMGQRLEALKTTPEGLVLQTSDGFLFAFLEDPTRVSLAQVQRLLEEVGPAPSRLVVLTPGRLPLALGAELLRRQSTLVESSRFQELARGLGLGEYLGEEPRPPASSSSPRLLPSAHQLDAIMQRGRSWTDWGVPALALRFFRQSSALKPEFGPARVGIGQALLGLGLNDDARRSFEEALQLQPTSVDARLGLAAVEGATGHIDREVAAYRHLLDEDGSRVAVRAHLVAALISQGAWKAARDEIGSMLAQQPEDPPMRFLLSVALEKTGATSEGRMERERARRLGLSPDRERALCEHLGLPPPELPPPPASASLSPAAGPKEAPPSPVPTDAAAPAAPVRGPSPASRRPAAAGRRSTGARKSPTKSRPRGRKPK